MKILFTICGRKGSKGIKNKNISYFAGYPLLYYTLSAIDLFQKAHTEYEMDTVISSDSLELLAMAGKKRCFCTKAFGDFGLYEKNAGEKEIVIRYSF